MNKILIIVPYYGNLPPYFSMWLKTCENNSRFNWLIVSDENNKYIEDELPSNVSFLNVSFVSLKDRIEHLLGFNFEHFTPYRLCDCRPLFGMLFESHIENYDFWGWCDMDLLFGDLSKYLVTERLNRHDKIYANGHLSLVKNSELVSSITKKMISDERVINIFKSKYPEGFDERYFNTICNDNDLNVFDEKECIDISPRFYGFRNINNKNKKVNVIYKDGLIFDDDNNEYPYVHFQKRSFKSVNLIKGDFFISHEGFTLEEPTHSLFKLFIYDSAMYFRFLYKYLIPQSLNRLKEKLR